MIYAGFWRRLAAALLDFVFLIPLALLTFVGDCEYRLFQLYYLIPGLAISLWYHVYLVQRYGGTPGKLVMGIRIRNLDGSPVDYQAALIRGSLYILLGTLVSIGHVIATLGMSDAQYAALGFMERAQQLALLAPGWHQPVLVGLQAWTWSELLVMLTNRKRRSLHDFMAGTVVVVVVEIPPSRDQLQPYPG